MDVEDSVVSVESDESTRCDRPRLGKSFLSAPTDLGEGVGVLSASIVGVAGVKSMRSTSSTSSSSSSEDRGSWKSGAAALERTVPMPSV